MTSPNAGNNINVGEIELRSVAEIAKNYNDVMDHSPQLEDTSLAVLEPEKCQPKLEGIEQALNVVPFDKGDEANVKKIVTGLQARGKEVYC